MKQLEVSEVMGIIVMKQLEVSEVTGVTKRSSWRFPKSWGQ